VYPIVTAYCTHVVQIAGL